MQLTVESPLSGQIIDLTEVPDVVFSSGIIGPGLAIQPDENGLAVAPISGVVTKIFPHAYMVTTVADPATPQAEIPEILKQGTTILVHLGLDTVKMNGRGFQPLVEEGQTVQPGDPIIRWEPELVEKQGYQNVCPVVVVDNLSAQLDDLKPNGAGTKIGDKLFQVIC